MPFRSGSGRGSTAAVTGTRQQKIGKGGTANTKEPAAQMDYLCSKSASIFGNGVHEDRTLPRGLLITDS